MTRKSGQTTVLSHLRLDGLPTTGREGWLLAVLLPLLLGLLCSVAANLAAVYPHGPLRRLTMVCVAGRDFVCRGCRSVLRGAYLFNRGRSRVLRKSTCGKQFHCAVFIPGTLATAAVMVFSRDTRISINGIISCSFFFFEGRTGLRAHTETLYTYSKGAWNRFAGLISDAIFGRKTKTLPHIEGLFRTRRRIACVRRQAERR